MPCVTPRSAPTNLNFESLSSTKRWYTEVVTNLRRRFRGSLILQVFWSANGYRSRVPPSPPLHCSPLSPTVSNRQQDNEWRDKAVAANSAIFPPVTAQIVAFERGLGGLDFAIRNSWRVRLKPLEVESEIRDDLYLIVLASNRAASPSSRFYIERRAATEAVRDDRAALEGQTNRSLPTSRLQETDRCSIRVRSPVHHDLEILARHGG
jgi:hypothetical protein